MKACARMYGVRDVNACKILIIEKKNQQKTNVLLLVHIFITLYRQNTWENFVVQNIVTSN